MGERFENISLIFFDSRRFLADLETGNPIQIFRDALNAANVHFNTRFLEGGDVRTLVNERASFMDRILFYAWNRFTWDKDIALLAVGGYGRHELHPHSDVDLMLLHKRNNVQRYRDSIEQFLTFLWDIQLKIGHSVRSLSQCVAEAKGDISVVTNLMESRTIVGDESLRRAMQEKTAPAKLWPSAKFFAAKRQEQEDRHRRHGFTEYNLEPNVKEAPGGLRDIQMISWVAHRHFRTTSPKDLVRSGFLTEDEYGLLLQGEDFLWKVRYGLHLLAGRPEERLLFDYQRRLAQMFGFRDTPKRLGVELFMQRYYRVVLIMRELNDVLLQYLDEVILRGDRARQIRVINERFQARDHYIETRHENIFHDHPSAMLELFVLMGENEDLKGIRAATIRQLRQHRHLIDDDFRADPVNRELFMRLLRSPHKMSHQMARMNRYGILGSYLPEFGLIVGQMQHDLFHIYPVDAHTLQLITNLRRFGIPEYAEQFPIAAHIYQNLTKPELLHIAGLYHDIAKGRGGDHSLLGADEVERFAERHGLGKQESRLLRWLVENHLLMSGTSQREDISDPDVILKFAAIVGDRLHLDYLYLLTVADINATNPTLWTSWKASLLRQLYFETRRALMRGLENPVDRQDWVNASRREALERLVADGISRETATSVWEGVDDDFFLQEKAEDIAAYIKAVVELPSEEHCAILIKDTGQETPVATQIFVHTRDKTNTFAITAMTLDRLRLDIQDARLHSTATGGSLNTFYVLDERARPFGKDQGTVEKVRKALTEALRNTRQGLAPVSVNIQRSTSRQLRHFSMRTVATIRNDINSGVTALEVVTPDRPGLLAHLGNIFMRFNLRLRSAKISTLGERVEDVFYLTDANDEPLGSQGLCESLRQAICEELDARNRQEADNGELRKNHLW